MDRRSTIMICGRSLFMTGIEAGLLGRSDLGVEHVEGGLAEAGAMADRLRPAAVLFELDEADAPALATFLRSHPGVALIGLDTESSAAVTFSGEMHAVPCANDLASVIRGRAAV